MASAFTAKVFTIVDTADAVGFSQLFAPNARLIFGNAEPMVGPDAIAAGIGAFFNSILALRHEVVAEWNVGPDTITTLRVTYTRLDGTAVTIPTASIWSVGSDGLIEHYQVFFDITPLFA